MKILQVCPYDIDRPGGVQAHIRDTAVALENLGHKVTIIAPRASGSPELALTSARGPIEILRIGTTRKIGLGGTRYELSIARGAERRRLSATMRQGDFDVVHYHTPWTPVMPFQAMRSAVGPAVATFHDTTSPDMSGALLRTGFRLVSRVLLPRLDAAIAVSTSPLENFRGPHAQRVEIVPPCTNLRKFLNVAPRAGAGDRVTILFIGRLEERKGALLLLQAYRRLCADGLPLRLVIAGTGEQENMLRNYVAANQLPAVEFVGAFEDGAAARLYADCDIFCAPSPYGESFGIVIAEAMASGRAVVAAANRGYSGLLTDEAGKFLVAPGDPDALYEALRRLVRSPELRVLLGAWGRLAAMRYDCSEVVPQLLDVYRRAIARFKAAGKPALNRRGFVPGKTV